MQTIFFKKEKEYEGTVDYLYSTITSGQKSYSSYSPSFVIISFNDILIPTP